jgi:hypothetical protein
VSADSTRSRRSHRAVAHASQAIPSPDRTYEFPELPAATYQQLPALLSDALPDDFGTALVNRYLADRGVPAQAVTLTPLVGMCSGAGSMPIRRNACVYVKAQQPRAGSSVTDPIGSPHRKTLTRQTCA